LPKEGGGGKFGISRNATPTFSSPVSYRTNHRLPKYLLLLWVDDGRDRT